MMSPPEFYQEAVPSPPFGEDVCGISEEEDSVYKGTFNFTHSPYGANQKARDDNTQQNAGYSAKMASSQSSSQGSRKSNSCNVYVSNLPCGVTDAWLRQEFGAFGLITSAKVMQAYSKKRVYAFVQYLEEDMARAAVEKANGVYVGSFPLVVKYADRDKDKGLPNQPSNNLYVSNLPTNYGQADLERLFKAYGQVSSSVVLTNPQTGAGRGVGLVRFFCVLEATKAMQSLHGTVLQGHDRPLEVKYAEDPETKQVRKMPKKQKDEPRPEDAKSKHQNKAPTPKKFETAKVKQRPPPLQTAHLPDSGVAPTPQVLQGDLADLPESVESMSCPSLQLNAPSQPSLPLPPPDPQASVYIGGLPRELQVLHAYQLFAPFGALISIDIQPDPRADTSYAYVQYRLNTDARYAVEQLDGAILGGRRLYSTIHSPQAPTSFDT